MRRFLILIFIILLINNANAFLISPPKIEVQFQPDLTQQYTISLFNNRQENINLATYVRYNFLAPDVIDLLNNSIILNTNSVSFTSADSVKTFIATLTLPSNIPDGQYDIRIGAVEEAVSGLVGSRSGNEVRLIITKGIVEQASAAPTSSIRRSTTSSLGDASEPAPGLIVEQKPSSFGLQIVTTTFFSFLLIILIILFFLVIMKRQEALAIVSLNAVYNKEDNVKIEAIIRNRSVEIIENIYLDIQVIDDSSTIIKTFNIGPIDIKPRYEGIVQRSWNIKGSKRGSYTVRLLLYHHKKELIKQIIIQLT